MTQDLEKLSAEDFLNGKLLHIDKPLGWTSFDAVKKIRFVIRKRFNLKKIKVGHAGTLDPLATGLLIICTGKFTKKIADLTHESKVYTGSFELGTTTPSYDLETEKENPMPIDHITEKDVKEAAGKLTGEVMQVPPIFSAKKVEGKRAYLTARKGKEVKLEPRPVKIFRFEIEWKSPRVHFEIECSKGTYIRSMARDLGEILGCGAHLSSLRREGIGDYSVNNAIDPQQFELLVGKDDTK